MLCECSNLDWSGCDLTAQHHPECKRDSADSSARVFNGTWSYISIDQEQVTRWLNNSVLAGSIRHTVSTDTNRTATFSVQQSVDGEHWEDVEGAMFIVSPLAKSYLP